MIQRLKSAYARLHYKTDKKLVIIASDDWGSERLRSKESRDALNVMGLKNPSRFNTYDSIERNDDLEALFEVLTSFKDTNGNHPIITAVSNVANPDFEKIAAGNFETYYYKSLQETWSQYQDADRVHSLYLEGIKNKIFIPQLHGREHVQVNWWMNELKDKNSFARTCFNQGFFFIPDNKLTGKYSNIEAAFNCEHIEDTWHYLETLNDAISLFEKTFLYKATYFTAPAMFSAKSLELVLSELGMTYIDTNLVQTYQPKNKLSLPVINYLLKRKSRLKAVVRNAMFEPNLTKNNNGVADCIRQIEWAFRFKQPAIISNHRAAFIGAIEPGNREKGLVALHELFTEILKRWPEVEFGTVSDLEN